jgi:Ser/Thr protein kinase RdoA (MazF antagonist)
MKTERVSVRELIELLRKCPDQDAFVVLPPHPSFEGADFLMVDGVEPRFNFAVVNIVAGAKGWF